MSNVLFFQGGTVDFVVATCASINTRSDKVRNETICSQYKNQTQQWIIDDVINVRCLRKSSPTTHQKIYH